MQGTASENQAQWSEFFTSQGIIFNDPKVMGVMQEMFRESFYENIPGVTYDDSFHQFMFVYQQTRGEAGVREDLIYSLNRTITAMEKRDFPAHNVSMDTLEELKFMANDLMESYPDATAAAVLRQEQHELSEERRFLEGDLKNAKDANKGTWEFTNTLEDLVDYGLEPLEVPNSIAPKGEGWERVILGEEGYIPLKNGNGIAIYTRDNEYLTYLYINPDDVAAYDKLTNQQIAASVRVTDGEGYMLLPEEEKIARHSVERDGEMLYFITISGAALEGENPSHEALIEQLQSAHQPLVAEGGIEHIKFSHLLKGEETAPSETNDVSAPSISIPQTKNGAIDR
jgi:hypothetical protein